MSLKSELASRAVLSLLVLFYALNLGPMVFESFTSDRTWASHPPESFYMFLGEYGYETDHWWRVVSPVALVLYFLFLFLNWRSSGRRKLLIVGFASFATVYVATIAYFVPDQTSLTANASSLGAGVLKARADQWILLNYFRTLAAVAGFAFLIAAAQTPLTGRADETPR